MSGSPPAPQVTTEALRETGGEIRPYSAWGRVGGGVQLHGGGHSPSEPLIKPSDFSLGGEGLPVVRSDF